MHEFDVELKPSCEERNMFCWGRLNMVITATALVWSLVIYIMYSNSLSSCFNEAMRLQMAVERKDRLLELLRDQNDDLKAEVSKLQVTVKARSSEEKLRKKIFRVEDVPFVSNRTV